MSFAFVSVSMVASRAAWEKTGIAPNARQAKRVME
jgi:hypothetical protein